MDSSRHRLILALAAALALVTSSCARPEPALPIGDGGLFSGHPCSPPCFWNITPGTTSRAQALEILRSDLQAPNCDHWGKDNSGREAGLRCSNVGLTFDDAGIVDVLSFGPTQPVAVADVIAQYGPPVRVAIGILGISMTPPIMMNLYFDHSHMVISLPEQNEHEYLLQPDTLVLSVMYRRGGTSFLSDPSLHPWHGYGIY